MTKADQITGEPPSHGPARRPNRKRLAEICQRLEAATSGPWALVTHADGFELHGPPGPGLFGPRFGRKADAEFVAWAGDDVAYLLRLLGR